MQYASHQYRRLLKSNGFIGSMSKKGCCWDTLNMEIVAEGIENKETWNMLLALGCDIGQGYYIAKPMSESEFEQWQFKG